MICDVMTEGTVHITKSLSGALGFIGCIWISENDLLFFDHKSFPLTVDPTSASATFPYTKSNFSDFLFIFL
jgi:hypothetical protein